jgi:hypothetical protein
MARIRTVKPEFFRHEGLQDLERENPGACVMLVFAGLWGHCDKEGRFEWRPRQLKLDILPFLDFDMEATLCLLEAAGHIESYEVAGKRYGQVPSFLEHQRISGKEAQEKAKNPRPPEKQKGSTGEASGKQSRPPETAGREGNGVQEGNGVTPASPGASAMNSKSLEAQVFEAGKRVLGKNSGGQITKLRRLPGMTDARALELIEEAGKKHDPPEWIAAVIRNGDDGGKIAKRDADVYRNVL